MIHLTSKSVEMRFDMPLAELILDFFDQLKSRTKAMPHSTTSSTSTVPPNSSSSIFCFRAMRWTRFRLSCTRIRPMAWPAACVTSSRKSSRASCSRCLFRRHRQQDHCPLYRQGASQGRFGQVLWRRYLAKAQAAREAERGQEAHEGHRFGRGPAGGLYGDPKGRRVSPWRFLNTASVCWAPMPSSRSLWLPWRA